MFHVTVGQRSIFSAYFSARWNSVANIRKVQVRLGAHAELQLCPWTFGRIRGFFIPVPWVLLGSSSFFIWDRGDLMWTPFENMWAPCRTIWRPCGLHLKPGGQHLGSMWNHVGPIWTPCATVQAHFCSWGHRTHCPA